MKIKNIPSFVIKLDLSKAYDKVINLLETCAYPCWFKTSIHKLNSTHLSLMSFVLIMNGYGSKLSFPKEG
jgi:hypothetical protein